MQVLHQSMLARLSYRWDGRTDRQTDRRTDGFSALYNRLVTLTFLGSGPLGSEKVIPLI